MSQHGNNTIKNSCKLFEIDRACIWSNDFFSKYDFPILFCCIDFLRWIEGLAINHDLQN